MLPEILITHAKGEESFAEKLAAPLRGEGYEVAHEGTVLVGDSVVAKAVSFLEQGGPVILCATERAVGNKFVRQLSSAARRLSQARLYIVQMEAEADVETISLGEKIATYWKDPQRAIADLLAALRSHYPTDDATGVGPQFMAAEERYRNILLESCDIVNLASLPEQDRHIAQRQQNLKLRGLYIPLRAYVELGISDEADAETSERLLTSLEERRSAQIKDWLRPSPTVEHERVTIGERLERARRLVVLGDPGAGKSTLLRWIATAYLLRFKRDENWKGLPDVNTLPDIDLLPIIVRCRDLLVDTLSGSLDDILRHTFRRSELSELESRALSQSLLRRLSGGSCILMLDGLDEISDPAIRARFCQYIETIVSAYPSAPIIATSRIVGYREMGYRLGRSFEHLTLADLAPADQNEFARRWCLLTEIPERQQTSYDELVHDIHSSDRIERLTSNPMLLTTMALVKRKVGKLPNRRADLYGEAVQVLLNWRREVDEPIDSREALPQLEYLSYSMCDRGVQRLRRDEIVEAFARLRNEYPNVHPVFNRSPEAFLSRLEARTGILIEAGHVREGGMIEPVYEFRHLTFQEYLAARALVDNKYPGRDPTSTLAEQIANLAGHVDEQSLGDETDVVVAANWHETLRLATGMCSDDIIDDVMLALVIPKPGEPAEGARARAELGALCLADEPNISDKTAETVINHFVENISGDDAGVQSTSYDKASIENSRGRWGKQFRRALAKRFGKLRGNADGAAGMLLGVSESLNLDLDSQNLSETFRKQGRRLSSEDELEAISAAFLIFYGILQACRLGNSYECPAEISNALISNLGRGGGVACSSAAALVALSNARLNKQFEDSARWHATEDQKQQIASHLEYPVTPLLTVQVLANIVEGLRYKSAVDRLLPWLAVHDEQTRADVSSALVEIGSPDILQSISNFFQDESRQLRRLALRAKTKLLGLEDSKTHLLTEDLDGVDPFIDPAKPITLRFAEQAANRLDRPVADIHSAYEHLADSLGLRLEWREEGTSASQPCAPQSDT